jgi:hypothetical protein
VPVPVIYPRSADKNPFTQRSRFQERFWRVLEGKKLKDARNPVIR